MQPTAPRDSGNSRLRRGKPPGHPRYPARPWLFSFAFCIFQGLAGLSPLPHQTLDCSCTGRLFYCGVQRHASPCREPFQPAMPAMPMPLIPLLLQRGTLSDIFQVPCRGVALRPGGARCQWAGEVGVPGAG